MKSFMKKSRRRRRAGRLSVYIIRVERAHSSLSRLLHSSVAASLPCLMRIELQRGLDDAGRDPCRVSRYYSSRRESAVKRLMRYHMLTMNTRSMWLLILIVVLLVAAYAAFSYGTIRQASVVGHRIADSAIPYEQHPADATMHILVMGDSTAAGTGALPNTESIAGLLGERYPRADITNISENGLELLGLVQKLPLVPRERPCGKVDRAELREYRSLADFPLAPDFLLHCAHASHARTLPAGNNEVSECRVYRSV